jgi:SAM-dependent methyltransferase
MSDAAQDRWASGDAYEGYMGRWSRVLARVFLEWLRAAPAAAWLDVGCGTGALTSAIAALCRPTSIVGCDPSQAFIERARRDLSHAATFCVIASAELLPERDGGFDVVVSGLVLNFVPDPARALAAMRARTRPGGAVAAYVWDYAGMELLSHFWEEAVAFDSSVTDETRRFASWQAAMLASLFDAAALTHVETGVLEITTEFADFDDYWRPFLAGTGPAPSYVASLDATRREQLRARLERRLAASSDGRIRLRARALAVRGSAT